MIENNPAFALYLIFNVGIVGTLVANANSERQSDLTDHVWLSQLFDPASQSPAELKAQKGICSDSRVKGQRMVTKHPHFGGLRGAKILLSQEKKTYIQPPRGEN